MSRKDYRPDYYALYRDLEIPDEVWEVLKKSDRKMEYMECDLKQERIIKGKDGSEDEVVPSREDSYERLASVGKVFVDAASDPEHFVIEQDGIGELHRCINLLEQDERALVFALFFHGMTEREYARIVGLKQQSIHQKKHKILAKLKKFLE